MEQEVKSKRRLKHNLYKIGVRLLISLGATVLSSVIYKALIEIGFFSLIESVWVFCFLELFFLLGYWHFTYFFSRKCRHRTRALKKHILLTLIVFAIYSAIYMGVFFISQDVFSWMFRLTLNLIALRINVHYPKNFLPYMIAYLLITLFILLMEPVFTKALHKKGITLEASRRKTARKKRRQQKQHHHHHHHKKRKGFSRRKEIIQNLFHSSTASNRKEDHS